MQHGGQNNYRYRRPQKVGNRIKDKNSAGIPHTLLWRIGAMGFPTFGLLLYYFLGFHDLLDLRLVRKWG